MYQQPHQHNSGGSTGEGLYEMYDDGYRPGGSTGSNHYGGSDPGYEAHQMQQQQQQQHIQQQQQYQQVRLMELANEKKNRHGSYNVPLSNFNGLLRLEIRPFSAPERPPSGN